MWSNRILDGEMRRKRVGSLFGSPYIARSFFSSNWLWLNKDTLADIKTLHMLNNSRGDTAYIEYSNNLVSGASMMGLNLNEFADYKSRYYLVELKFKNGDTCTAQINYKLKSAIESILE